jgi:hypothetical protein
MASILFISFTILVIIFLFLIFSLFVFSERRNNLIYNIDTTPESLSQGRPFCIRNIDNGEYLGVNSDLSLQFFNDITDNTRWTWTFVPGVCSSVLSETLGNIPGIGGSCISNTDCSTCSGGSAKDVCYSCIDGNLPGRYQAVLIQSNLVYTSSFSGIKSLSIFDSFASVTSDYRYVWTYLENPQNNTITISSSPDNSEGLGTRRYVSNIINLDGSISVSSVKDSSTIYEVLFL